MEKELLELKQEIAALEPKIDKKIEEFNTTAAEVKKELSVESAKEVKEALKNELKEVLGYYETLKGTEEEKGILQNIQEQVDGIATEWKKIDEQKAVNNFTEAFKKASEGKVEAMLSGKKMEFEFQVEKKAVVTEAGALTGDVVVPGLAPGIFVNPQEMRHIRQIMSVGSTTSNRWWHNKETGYTDAAAAIAEGAAFPQSDLAVSQLETVQKKLATHMKLSNEILSDIPGMQTYASGRLRTHILLLEDNQVLLGDGTGQNVSGINTNAVAYAPTAFLDYWALNGSNEIDQIVAGVNQLKVTTANGLFSPTWVVLHPTDVTKLQLIKDGDSRYLNDVIYRDGIFNIKGVPVFQTTIQTEGTFTIGDFTQGTQLIDSEFLTIEVSNSDQDDFIKDLVTIRAKEQVILPIYFTGAFTSETFATAKLYVEAP